MNFNDVQDVDTLKAYLQELENKVERLQKEKAAAQGMGYAIPTGEDYKEKGQRYGFLQARRDTAKGILSPLPLWDDKTAGRFVGWIKAVSQKDTQAIKKAFGDNAYTETTTAGGYLVPQEFRPELIRLAYQRSIALQKCRIVPMGSNTLKMPTVTSGYTAAWGAINTQISDAKVTFGEANLTAEKLVALSLVPNELLNDSALSVADLLSFEFGDAFGKAIDEEAFQGDTSDTANHKFNGIDYAASVSEVAGDTGDSADGVITPANLVSAPGLVDDAALDGAEWFMHPTVWPVVRKLADTNTDLLVNLDRPYSYGLLGFPVNRRAQVTPTKASIAAGGAVMIFGNLRNVIIGDRAQLDVAISEHVRFEYDQTAFRCTQRLAIDVPAAVAANLVKITRGPAA